MKTTSLLFLLILFINIGFISCKSDSENSHKSDSEKMIEKCMTHIAALDSIHSKLDFEVFLETHPNCLGDFLTAIRNDSIYANQDLTQALPYLFKAVYETIDKQEGFLLLECKEPVAEIIVLVGMYTLKIPYCTKVSQLQYMAHNLDRVISLIAIKDMPNSFEAEAVRLANDCLYKPMMIRKTEIEEGNLYDSQFLK